MTWICHETTCQTCGERHPQALTGDLEEGYFVQVGDMRFSGNQIAARSHMALLMDEIICLRRQLAKEQEQHRRDVDEWLRDCEKISGLFGS